MRKQTAAWAMFAGGILLLSLGATPYSKTADLALIAVRLSAVLVLSVLIVRERWRARAVGEGKKTAGTGDPGDGILRRFRRWYYDEDSTPR
jgi:hypothetical protein